MPKDPRDADTSARSNQSDSFCFHESGMRVSFQDVTYLVQNRANRKEKLAILKGVSGFCQPGEPAVFHSTCHPSDLSSCSCLSYTLLE